MEREAKRECMQFEFLSYRKKAALFKAFHIVRGPVYRRNGTEKWAGGLNRIASARLVRVAQLVRRRGCQLFIFPVRFPIRELIPWILTHLMKPRLLQLIPYFTGQKGLF